MPEWGKQFLQQFSKPFGVITPGQTSMEIETADRQTYRVTVYQDRTGLVRRQFLPLNHRAPAVVASRVPVLLSAKLVDTVTAEETDLRNLVPTLQTHVVALERVAPGAHFVEDLQRIFETAHTDPMALHRRAGQNLYTLSWVSVPGNPTDEHAIETHRQLDPSHVILGRFEEQFKQHYQQAMARWINQKAP